ncbi:MAG: ribulokinase [Phycisphaerales bacterium]
MSESGAFNDRLALGLDFGTEAVRALLVDLKCRERASAAVKYPHGVISETLPGTDETLPADFALQHPGDWLDASCRAVREALTQAGLDASAVPIDLVGIGVDFTSCTMLPARADGTALCQCDGYAGEKYAWPKLWKHHGVKTQTDKINKLARERNEDWLSRYGGVIGLEWFFPKILETLEEAPHIYDATGVWLEGGDWYVWQLIGADKPVPRSTCIAGYKAMWDADDGYPSSDFFAALHPKMADVVNDKMPGTLIAPGRPAGTLCAALAKRMGLREGIPVSAAIIDAHSGVPGVGVGEPNTLVMVMGTSSCHMLMHSDAVEVPGVAGIVRDGILPGYVGYETGQAAVGDAFDWLRRMLNHENFDRLTEQAMSVPPGCEGVTCVDWFNGCRTPLMDGSLAGAFTGLTMNHHAGHMFRSLLEASAFGVRWIVDVLERGGVPVDRFVATGGLPHHNPLLMQIYTDVLGKPIDVPDTKQGPALGAAILGVLAAGQDASGFADTQQAVKAMAGGLTRKTYTPDNATKGAYDKAYQRYRQHAGMIAGK